MKYFALLMSGIIIGWSAHTYYRYLFPLTAIQKTTQKEEFQDHDPKVPPTRLPDEPGEQLSATLEMNSEINAGIESAGYSEVPDYLEIENYNRAVDVCSGEVNEKWRDCRKQILDFALSDRISISDFRFLLELWLAQHPGDIDAGVILVEHLIENERYIDAVEMLASLKSYQYEQKDIDRISREAQKLARTAIIKLTLREDYRVLRSLLLKLIDIEPNRSAWRFVLSKLEVENEHYENAINHLTFILYDPEYGDRAGYLYGQALQKLNLSRYTEIPLVKLGNQYQLKAFLNGTKEISLVLDTGAVMTSIDSGILENLGVVSDTDPVITLNTAGGKVQSSVVNIGSFDIGGAVVRDLKVASLDLSAGRIQGLLGMNFLDKFKFVIDQKKGRLYLNPK